MEPIVEQNEEDEQSEKERMHRAQEKEDRDASQHLDDPENPDELLRDFSGSDGAIRRVLPIPTRIESVVQRHARDVEETHPEKDPGELGIP